MVLFRFRIFILLTFLSQNLLSQLEIDCYGKSVTFYKTNQIQYTIHGQLDTDKKTVFFIEGSTATPSYYKYNDSVYYTGPSELMNLTSEFNLIIFGKPAVPMSVDYNLLNEDLIYRDSMGSIPKDYLMNDNMEFYSKNYNSVINDLVKKFNLEDIYVFGHSQGSRIAAELVLRNTNIKGIILSSVDPLGRIATMIDKNHANSEKKDKIDYLQSIVNDGSNLIDSTFMSSTYFSWKTFSYPLIITLSEIDIPILMVYGTRDANCPNCYVYGYFNTYHPNFDSLSYESLDHNFFDAKGDRYWGEVVQDITSWINNK